MGFGLIRRVFAACLWVGGACAWGQAVFHAQDPAKGAPGEAKTTITMPPTPLLPQTLGGLNPAVITRADSDVMRALLQNFENFDAKTCLPALPGPVAVPPHPVSTAAQPCTAALKEDGIQRLAAGSYSHKDAGARVEISVLEFVDATGAYSAYTFYRSRVQGSRLGGGEARTGKLAIETSVDAEGTLLWAGTVVVRIKGRMADADLKTLVTSLPKVGGRRGLAPLLPTMVPAEAGGARFEPASLRYALGPVGYGAMGGVLDADMLAWDKSAEVATATYSGKGNQKGTLTLLLYPTPQIAGDRGRAVEKYINDAGPGKFGTVRMRRVGPLVGVVTGGLTGEQAEALVQALHLNEMVTFDKPMPLEFHAEVRKTATLLQSIAVFTGVLILAAIVIGVFLGGARAGIRVLRGKPAASEPEFLSINLRDQPKALLAAKRPKAGKPTP